MPPTPEKSRFDDTGLRRRLLTWQVIVYGALILAITTMNVFTTLANKAFDGVHLS